MTVCKLLIDAPLRGEGRATENRAGCEVTDVHQKDEHERHYRSVKTELGSALNHLGNAQLRPLRRVGSHERHAEQVAYEQGEQCQGSDNPIRTAMAPVAAAVTCMLAPNQMKKSRRGEP